VLTNDLDLTRFYVCGRLRKRISGTSLHNYRVLNILILLILRLSNPNRSHMVSVFKLSMSTYTLDKLSAVC